jgi:tRNA (guanine10-N2)-methyltransferase
MRYHVLIEFAYRHLDFQLPELDSVLEMSGIRLGSDGCRVEALVNETRFAQELARDKGHAPTKNGPASKRPFVLLSLPADSEFVPGNAGVDGLDIGSIIMSRCVLVRSVCELWGMAETTQGCAEKTRDFIETGLGKEIFQKQSAIDKSWKMTIHLLGSKASREDQSAKRAAFQFLDFQGPVLMDDPTNEFILIQEVELDANGSPLYPKYDHLKRPIRENADRAPLATYFGRTIGTEGRKKKGRGGFEEYNLKKRPYIGPTSMDAELSFVMTNLGLVRPSDVVLDPFVGTGSILLSCACRGAHCVGTDIDIRVLRGKGEDQNIWANFQQFSLPRPDIIRSDNAIHHRHFRPHEPLYDAILTDPPYGIRAGARKSGSRKANPRPVNEEERHDHIAQTMPYSVSDVMADLLDMAARTLRMDGRLVYIIPSFSNFDPQSDLPQHECLTLVHWCYQPLSTELGRRIVVMKKTSEYFPTERDRYLRATWKVPGAADKVAGIREKIIEAAKLKPNYEERLSHRKLKRQEHKQEKKRLKTLAQATDK